MKVHPQFKCNDTAYSIHALKAQAQRWKGSDNEQERYIGGFILDWLSPTPTLHVQTSGSTGKPKQLVVNKEFMANSARMTGAHFGLKAGDTALLCLPANYIAGKMMLVRAMVLGLHLDLRQPSVRPLEHISKTYDFGAMVPLQAWNSLQQLQRIRTLLLGGAPVSPALSNELASMQNGVYETFGMTETISHIAVRKLSGGKDSANHINFQVLPGVKIAVDNRRCLVIDAPRIANDKIVTNDLVDITGEHHFQWLGRFDNVVNSGGLKLIPEQIEAKLESSIAGRFFLAGIPDPTLGQKLVLVIEGTNEQYSLAQLQETGHLTRFEIPKEVFSIAKFPETSSGKINRTQTLKFLQLI